MSRIVVDGTNTIYEGDGTGELEKDSNTCFHLVELHTSGVTGIGSNFYLTDSFNDVSWTSATTSSTNTYSAAGGFLTFTPVSETTQLKVNTINVSLSGVDNSTNGIIADVLNYDIVNTRAVIYRSFGVSSASDTTKTFMIFDGNIKSFQINEAIDQAVVTIAVATHWADFDKKMGRITNSTTQSKTYKYGSTSETFADDNGFVYASAMIGDIQWGPTN